MKNFNLTVAIIYSIFLLWALVTSTDDGETMLGLIMIMVPVVANWMSYVYIKNREDTKILKDLVKVTDFAHESEVAIANKEARQAIQRVINHFNL